MARKGLQKHPITTGNAWFENLGGNTFMLYINDMPSSKLALSNLQDPGFEHMRNMLKEIAKFAGGWENNFKVLHLGAAGCALPLAINKIYPQSRQVAVDIDELLINFVRDFFQDQGRPLPSKPVLSLRCGDALKILEEYQDNRFNLIILDVFDDFRIPEHLTTENFSSQIKRVLIGGAEEKSLFLANCNDLKSAKNLQNWFEKAGFKAELLAEHSVLNGAAGNIVFCATIFC